MMVVLFILLFTIHELEEIVRLPRWVNSQRRLLSTILPRIIHPVLHITIKGFALIAIWEGVIVIAVSVFLPESMWWFGMLAAYTLHLLIHCGQWLMLYRYGLTAPKLYSVMIELPLCSYLMYSYIKNVHQASALELMLATHSR